MTPEGSLDAADTLNDENNLMADLEFEQMLTEASNHRPTGEVWLESPRPLSD